MFRHLITICLMLSTSTRITAGRLDASFDLVPERALQIPRFSRTAGNATTSAIAYTSLTARAAVCSPSAEPRLSNTSKEPTVTASSFSINNASFALKEEMTCKRTASARLAYDPSATGMNADLKETKGWSFGRENKWRPVFFYRKSNLRLLFDLKLI